MCAVESLRIFNIHHNKSNVICLNNILSGCVLSTKSAITLKCILCIYGTSDQNM